MQHALRIINGPGWRQRLAPLGQFLADRRQVRARSDRGAALALIALDTLREALVRLLRHDPSRAYLVIALAVENAPADVVASDVGIDRAQLVEVLRTAMTALALQYESVAFASAVEERDLGSAMRAAARNALPQRQ